LNKVWYSLFILFVGSIFQTIAIIAQASVLFLAVFNPDYAFELRHEGQKAKEIGSFTSKA